VVGATDSKGWCDVVIAQSLPSPQQEELVPFPNGTAVVDEAFPDIRANILTGGAEQSDVIYDGGDVRTRPNSCLQKVGEQAAAAPAASAAKIDTNTVKDPVLAKYATEIRRLGKRIKDDVIEIGRYLYEAQEHAGRGPWHLWINAEFGWSDQTAYRYIHLYQAHQNSDFHKLWDSDLPLSGLYQLAAPKTPNKARTEIAKRVEAGEKISCATVTEVVTKAKGGKTNSANEVDVDVRRAQMAALDKPAADEHGTDHHGDGDHLDQHIDEHVAHDHGGADQRAGARVRPTAVPPTPKKNLLKAWEATDDERQLIRDLVLQEYFAQASGADIHDRIPRTRLTAVCRELLDEVGVPDVLAAMSEKFGRQLRERLPAPRRGKSFKHTMNLKANSARNGRGHRSRH
jgi:hypothetical protein